MAAARVRRGGGALRRAFLQVLEWGGNPGPGAVGSGVVLMCGAGSWVAFGDLENEELEAALSRGDDTVDFGAGR